MEIQVVKNIGEKRRGKKVEKGENIVNWLNNVNDEERREKGRKEKW